MGADIKIFGEKQVDGEWVTVDIKDALSNRCYSIFGWLADIRNWSQVGPLSAPRGLPKRDTEKRKELIEIYYANREGCYPSYEDYYEDVFAEYDVSEEVAREYADDSQCGCTVHSTWYSVDELLDVDYNQIVEDRRCTMNIHGVVEEYQNGGDTCNPGDGVKLNLRSFLGEWYFEDLNTIVNSGAERIIFWFDQG